MTLIFYVTHKNFIIYNFHNELKYDIIQFVIYKYSSYIHL